MVQFSPGVSCGGVVLSGFVVCWVLCVVGGWLVCVSFVCSVSCWCSSVGSVLFWVVRCFVVLLVLVAPPGCCSCCCWSSGWLWWLCCSVRFFAPGGVAGCWCVSPVRCTVLVLVAPGWFMLLLVRVLLFWWFLVVVGPPPLFLVRHDQVRLCFSCGFNAECHPGWVAVWCFCSWRFMGVCLGVRSCS